MKLRLILTCEYEVIDAMYGGPENAIELNQKVAEDDPFLILDDYPWAAKVEEIKHGKNK